MTRVDPYLKEVFPQPPLIYFRRQRNIKDHIIRAKIPVSHNLRNSRKLFGMETCNKFCHACPYIRTGKEVKSDDHIWKINKNLNCETTNIIYLIFCDKERCKENKYVGGSERSQKNRLGEHKGYIKNM